MLSQLRGEVVPTVLTVQRLVLENSMAVEMSSKLSQEKLELDEGLEDMQAMQKVEEMASRRMPATQNQVSIFSSSLTFHCWPLQSYHYHQILPHSLLSPDIPPRHHHGHSLAHSRTHTRTQDLQLSGLLLPPYLHLQTCCKFNHIPALYSISILNINVLQQPGMFTMTKVTNNVKR